MTVHESKSAIALIALSFLLVFFSSQLLRAQVEGPGPGSGAGTARSDSSDAVTPGGALLRSAILPGWGQIYTGHKVKGVAMIIADATIIGLAIHADTRVKDLAVPGGDQLILEEWRNKRENRILLAVGLILYSMADAFVDAHLHDFGSDDARFGVEVEPPPGNGLAPGIRISLAFPLGANRLR